MVETQGKGVIAAHTYPLVKASEKGAFASPSTTDFSEPTVQMLRNMAQNKVETIEHKCQQLANILNFFIILI